MNLPTLASVEVKSDDHFVARYIASSEHHLPKLPTFANSIDVFKQSEGIATVFESLPKDVSCLFQGYTAPCNVLTLEHFLNNFGIKLNSTLAIDLLDIPGIYMRLGVSMPEMKFVQGDAGDLTNCADTSSIDIVIQDFILNCSPTVFAHRLLKEARRVLKPDGIAMVSFTDSSCLRSSISIREAVNRLGVAWKPYASGLTELADTPAQLKQLVLNLIGSTLQGDLEDHLIFITPPEGRFEFFQPLSNTIDLIRDAGFDVVDLQRSVGRDAADLLCMRNRCLLRPK